MTFNAFSKLSDSAFDKIGYYNPQLLREWQGRLRWRNLLLVGLLSFVVQAALVLQRLIKIPTKRWEYQTYCVKASQDGSCLLGTNEQVSIDWAFLWADVFHDLSFVLVWGLIVGGVYLLAADLAKESRRGTLNFLRMSPQPGRRVLVGKLLGVPILLYLGAGMMVPMHLATGLMASYPLSRIVTFYGLLGAITFFFYAVALWFALMAKGLQGFQTWLIAGLSCALLLLGWNFEHLSLSTDWFHFFNPLYHLADWQVQGAGVQTVWPFYHGEYLRGFRNVTWFLLPIGQYTYGFLAFSMVNASVLGLWFWTVLERKFQMPTNTILSKRQSYGLTLWLSLIVMGFELQDFPGSGDNWGYLLSMLIWSVLLLFLLLPSKQLLMDWTRYRHQPFQLSKRSYRKRSLLSDLATHDGSPFVFAFAMNFGVMAGVLLLGMAISELTAQGVSFETTFVSWLLISASLITCALIVQLIALSNMLHWRWVAFGGAIAMIAGLPILIAMMGFDTYGGSPLGYFWLLTVFPQVAMADASLGVIMLTMTFHIALISSFSLLLICRCKVLGQSEWQALTATKSSQLQTR